MEKFSYKTLFTIVVILLIGIVVLIRIKTKPTSVEAAWYNTGWTSRLMLTIDHTKVTADQTDFPILVSLANLPADFHSKVNQTDARDIRVTKSDGTTELPREVVYYDSATDAGELYFKYSGTLSSTVDTSIYIYYGNSGATDYDSAFEFGKNNVWDSNYVGVWHLNEVGTTRYDSTSNNNHLAISGTVSNATGKIGTAASFTQAGDLFRTDTNLSSNFPSKNGQTVTDLSASFWVKATTLGWHDWLGKENGTGWYFYDNTTSMGISYINGSEYGTFGGAGSVTTGTWYNITGVHNSTTDTDFMYINGAVGGTEVSRTVDPGSSSASFMLGGTTSWPTDANGLVDEVRVSKSVRSATWVSTEHNNQNSPSTFFSATIPTESGDDGPIVWWKFDESSGDTFYDSSGHSYNATRSSGTFRHELGKFGRSFQTINADGVLDMASAGDIAALDFSNTQSYTISTWFRHIAKENWNYFVFYKGGEVNTSTGYNMGVDGTNGQYYCNYTDGNGSGMDTVVSTTVADSNWHLVTCVMDRTGTATGTIGYHIFVDGKLEASDTSLTEGSAASNTHSVQLGETDLSYEMGMGIDDFKIYGYAQSPTQIKAEFNHSAGTNVGNDTNDINTKGLVGWWKLDENTNTTVIDSSGNNLTGSLVNTPAWTPGKFGSGLYFDPLTTNKYVNVGNSSTVNNLSQFTYSFWVKPTQLQDKDIINKGPGFRIYFENISSGLRTQFFTNCTGATNLNIYSTSADDMVLNEWHNVIVSWDGTSCKTSSVKIFIDGIQTHTHANSTDGIGSRSSESSYPILLGNSNGLNTQLQGTLDDVRLYSRALSASEAISLYRYSAPPIGHWKMEEASWTNNCSTNTAMDSSGYDHHLRSCPASTGPTGGSVGKFGKGGTFDGSNDYLESTSTDFNLTGNVTLSAWVRPLDTPPGDAYVIDRTNNNAGYSLGWQSSRTPRLRIGNGSTYLQLTSPNALSLDTWSFLSATITSDGAASLYVNGHLDTGATGMVIITSSGQNLRIGSRAAVNTVNAQLDDVKIYNYVRTQSQIMEDMGSGSPLIPIYHLKLDENSGTTAHDSSINRLDTTLSSASWSNISKYNSSWNGDGTNWLSITDAATSDKLDFSATADFSISLWFKSDSATNPAGSEYILSKSESSPGYRIFFDNTTNGDIFFGTDDDTTWTPGDKVGQVGKDYYDATWHHLVAVKTGLTRMELFIDGVSVGSKTALVETGTLENSINLYIGDRNGVNGGDEFNGDIDDVQFFSSALDQNQVKTIYNNRSVFQTGSSNQTIGATTTSLKYCVPGDTSPCSAPIGEWNFDTNVGTPSTLPDTSGNGNNGVANGGMTSSNWVPGKNGSALNFDGSNDYINIYSANLASLFSGNQGTVTAWFRVGDGVWGDGVQHQVLTIGADVNNMITIRKASDGSLNTLYTAAATNETSLDCALTNTGYIFMAMSWDQTAGKVVHYCNGLITDTDTALGAYTGALSSTRATIGAHTTGITYPWKGDIDDLRIYNYVRTPAQVGLDYNQGGPLVWYKFDECQGSIIHNSMGTGYTGVISIGAAGTQTSLGTCNSGTAAAWTNGASGKINGSLNFDGNDDLAAVTEAETKGSLDIGSSDSFSVAYWFNPTSLPGAGTYDTYAGKNNGGNGWYTQIYSDGSLEFCVVNTSVHCYSGNQNVVNVGAWNHYAVAYTSGDDSSIRLYHNGKLLTGSWGGTANLTVPNTNNNLAFGSNGDGTEEATGKIDDFRYYGYLLTETQIKSIINNGSATFR